MTLQNSAACLQRAVASLWDAVSELALICFEDQPDSAGLAGVDDLSERISELQADVAAARELCARPDRPLADWLAPSDQHLRRADLAFWRDLQAAVPLNRLQVITRRAGGQWPAWLRSIRQSAERVKEPLNDVTAALNACWQDACQQWAPATAAGITPRPTPAPDQTRRIS
jgi:hypothetical protein